jgi:hypothetical protein
LVMARKSVSLDHPGVPGWVGSKALRPWKSNHKRSNWDPYAE